MEHCITKSWDGVMGWDNLCYMGVLTIGMLCDDKMQVATTCGCRFSMRELIIERAFLDVKLLPAGKKFFQKKKQPIPVDLTNKDWAAQVRKATEATYMYHTGGTSLSIRQAGLFVDSVQYS